MINGFLLSFFFGENGGMLRRDRKARYPLLWRSLATTQAPHFRHTTTIGSIEQGSLPNTPNVQQP